MMVVVSGCAVDGGEAELADEGTFADQEGADELDNVSESLTFAQWWARRRDGGQTADSGSTTSDAGIRDAGSQADAQVVKDAGLAQDAGAIKDSGSKDASVVSDAGNVTPKGRSSGCGRAASGNDNFDNRTMRVGSTDRTYHVRVPASYDANRAYPVVFRWHGTGGNGLSGGLNVEYSSGANAIVVGPDGIGNGWTSGSEAGDLAFFDAMLDTLSAQYCVDLDRVFAYGFSAGGGMTNALGCKRADKIRGTAAIAGFDRSNDTCATKPVAAWFLHDRDDPAVPFSQGTAARDRVIKRNGCSTQTTSSNGCVNYSGCKSGYPVTWCETSGLGHNIDGPNAPAKVWTFFSAL